MFHPFVNFERFTKGRLLTDSRSCQTSGVLQHSWRVSFWTKLTLVVDGIDEGLIRVPNFIPYLTAELRDLPLQRLQVILVCRTAEWSLAAGNQLLGLWNESDDNAVFELCPLRHQDARLAAQTWKLDADKFMSEVCSQSVSGLASRPTTLMFLLREFSLRGTFPGTHFDLYDSGCKRLCEEHDSKRLAALHYQQPAPNPFPAAEVHQMATQMAVLLMVCGKSSVYVGDKDATEPTDLLVEQIIDAPSEKHLVYAALSTALFSARGPERFGFAHQTFAECLAAQGLRSLPLIQVRSALCQRDGQVEHVVPQLAETAAWLAAMRDDFLEFVMAREPEVLLRSDVSRIQAQHKEQLVAALLDQAKREEAFDEGDMRKFYAGLKHPSLASQLWPYISDPSLNFVVRRMAIGIAGDCKLSELMTDFLNLLRTDRDGALRHFLAHSLKELTPTNRAHELIPLAKGEVGPDDDDTIKGCALQVLVPNVWSVTEALPYITSPKDDHFFGAYHSLLRYHLPKHVRTGDLKGLLSKLVEWEDCFDSLSYFDKLADKTMTEAMQQLDDPDTAELAVEVWRQKSQHHLDFGEGDDAEFKRLLQNASNVRLSYVAAILNSPKTTIGDTRRLAWSASRLLLVADLPWALTQISVAAVDRRDVWAETIRLLAHPEAAAACWDELLARIESVPELKARFAWLRAYDLDEPEARKLKADWLREERRRAQMQRLRKELPDPESLIQEDLVRIDQGKSACWMDLCDDLRLKENGSFGSGDRYDIITFDGWKAADENRRSQIRHAARCFLIEHDDGYAALGKRTNFSDPGYLAIALLSDEIDTDAELRTAVGTKWIDAITGRFNNGEEEHQRMVTLAYGLSPDRCIEGLLREVRDDDERHGQILALRAYELCWDERLSKTLVDLIQSDTLKLSSIESTLSFLAEVDSSAAVECAKTLLPPGIEHDTAKLERTKGVLCVALGQLVTQTWDTVWPLLQKERALAEHVMGRIAYGMDYQAKKTLLPVASEQQLSELYLLLNAVFPPEEDPPHQAGEVSPRRMVVNFKGEFIGVLTARGTAEACHQLMQLSSALPSQRLWLRRRYYEALRLKRRKAWQPPAPEIIGSLLKNPAARVIEDADDLLEVVMESLRRYQEKLVRSELPEAAVLWNYDGSGNQRRNFRPKDEEDLSDRVAVWIDSDIGTKTGVVIGREVQPRRGQKTDIMVTALVKGANAQTLTPVTIIIEVKGCWHKEVRTAIETQLVAGYLVQNGWTHGIYLVGWFDCDRWDAPTNTPKSSLNAATYEDACKEVDALAAPYDGVGKSEVVKGFCLDCRFPG